MQGVRVTRKDPESTGKGFRAFGDFWRTQGLGVGASGFREFETTTP